MLRVHILANQCCMYCCDRESVDYLLHCPVIHTLWTFMCNRTVKKEIVCCSSEVTVH